MIVPLRMGGDDALGSTGVELGTRFRTHQDVACDRFSTTTVRGPSINHALMATGCGRCLAAEAHSVGIENRRINVLRTRGLMSANFGHQVTCLRCF